MLQDTTHTPCAISSKSMVLRLYLNGVIFFLLFYRLLVHHFLKRKIFSTDFNTIAPLFAHQLLTRSQIIDSRGAFLAQKADGVVHARIKHLHCIEMR